MPGIYPILSRESELRLERRAACDILKIPSAMSPVMRHAARTIGMSRLSSVLVILLSLSGAFAAPAPSFTIGWSVYVGWNPYQYLARSGILKKWAEKYNVAIKVQRFDYAPSLDAFVAKNIDACAMTNMEALDMPAAAGVDTTAVILGDYSNGNDAVITRNLTLAQ